MKIALVGIGGHGKVVANTLRETGKNIDIIIDKAHSNIGGFQGVLYDDDDSFISNEDYSECIIVNGIGYLPRSKTRYEVYKKYTNFRYKFLSVISANASVSSDLIFGEGIQILSRAVIQCGVRIGSNSIINNGVLVDHDCTIGQNVHLAPGSIICGNVTIGDGCFIGAGAVVINNINICAGSIIGAGAVVRKDVLKPDVII